MIIHADKSAKWSSADCANVAWFLNTIPALKIAAMNLMPMYYQRSNSDPIGVLSMIRATCFRYVQYKDDPYNHYVTPEGIEVKIEHIREWVQQMNMRVHFNPEGAKQLFPEVIIDEKPDDLLGNCVELAHKQGGEVVLRKAA